MRKIIFGVAVFATIWSFGFAKSKKTDSEAEKKQKTEQTSEQDSKASNSDEWKEVGNQGKKALKETGIFFKDLGKKIGSEVKEAAEDVKEAAKDSKESKEESKQDSKTKNTKTKDI